jgi:hypothetical protein
VQYDCGENVAFKGGFAIHDQTHFQKITGKVNSEAIQLDSNSFELYFETDSIEETSDMFHHQDVQFIHEIKKQPWGQRVMRIYDPDRHLIEIGETMEAVFAFTGKDFHWKKSLEKHRCRKSL